MKVNIVVCDDQEVLLQNIHNKIIDISQKMDITPEIHLYADGKKLADLVCHGEEKIDILFLDIDMPEISGLEVAKQVRESQLNPILIFISAYAEYVFESIKYNPFRYIRKNRIEQELPQALKSACLRLFAEHDAQIVVKTEDENVKLMSSDIMYFHTESRKVKIHMKDERVYITRKTLEELCAELAGGNFIMIDKGCVINISYVSAFTNRDITLDNGERLSVSRPRKIDVKNAITSYWRDKV